MTEEIMKIVELEIPIYYKTTAERAKDCPLQQRKKMADRIRLADFLEKNPAALQECIERHFKTV